MLAEPVSRFLLLGAVIAMLLVAVGVLRLQFGSDVRAGRTILVSALLSCAAIAMLIGAAVLQR